MPEHLPFVQWFYANRPEECAACNIRRLCPEDVLISLQAHLKMRGCLVLGYAAADYNQIVRAEDEKWKKLSAPVFR